MADCDQLTLNIQVQVCYNIVGSLVWIFQNSSVSTDW